MIPDKILAFHKGMKSFGSGTLFTLNMKHVTSYLVGFFLLAWAWPLGPRVKAEFSVLELVSIRAREPRIPAKRQR